LHHLKKVEGWENTSSVSGIASPTNPKLEKANQKSIIKVIIQSGTKHNSVTKFSNNGN
jgi:hypothetical protein